MSHQVIYDGSKMNEPHEKNDKELCEINDVGKDKYAKNEEIWPTKPVEDTGENNEYCTTT